jgi:geranylgeranyl diphosphate synthase type I
VAFQLRDDVLGLVGDPSRTGKGCNDDLREGKRTVLLLRTLARADAPGREVVLAALADPAVDDDTCDRVRAVVERSGALAEIEDEITGLVAVATAAVRGLPQPARDALLDLAHAITQRDR